MKYVSYITPLMYLSRKNARFIIKRICPRDLYTGQNLQSRYWTLEHIVPQSRISEEGKKNDLHNLSGVESVLNNLRGNKKFGDSMVEYKLYDECKISKDMFSPLIGKGEVARVCAYMIETYGSAIDHKNLIDEDTMFRWNTCPPDDQEKRKNELIYNVQGGYNRFVDDYKLLYDFKK